MTRDGFRDSAERLVVLAALVLLCAAAVAQLSFAPSAQTRHDAPQSAGPADAGVLLDGPFCYHAAVRADERSESPASSVVTRSFKRVRPANSRSFQPSAGQTEVLAVIGKNQERRLCDWIIDFPLYGGVENVEIGLKEGSVLLEPKPHKVPHPVLFYGSSITQGGCASRPGNAYTSMLCRTLDAEQINLGFSGSGKGEPAVAEAIASLDLAAFVLDYDHNAPDAEHLKKTHEQFFRIVRKAHPDLPILILSKCNFWGGAVDRKRRDIIRATYEHAVAEGDRKVRFIDGEILFGTDPVERSWCTVDRCHPNDLGFFRMYQAVLPVLKEVLEK